MMSGYGRFTKCDLSNTACLGMPWAEINGQMRPQFSKEAAKISLELAATAYDMEVDNWREAGWHDISYQVDHTLLTGPQINKSTGRGITGMIGDYFQYLAQSRLKRQNPISQIRGALRQKEGSDTCKAVVMIHSLPAGRYVVAIGFMGTGKQIYDWFSNFRLDQVEGAHEGFLQLTKSFEKNCADISFPDTAKELHLEKLTLQDILQECRAPGSRFRIWMAGHSKGGAVMQLFCFREINRGLLRQNMYGFGFASPSVLYDQPRYDVSSYPLYHIINSDDSFPRMGAKLHIGRCQVLTPENGMRSFCYREQWKEPAFREMLEMAHCIYDSASAILLILALLSSLQALPLEEAVGVLSGLAGSLIPDALLSAFDTKKEDMLNSAMAKITNAYFRLTGKEDLPRDQLLHFSSRMTFLINQYGVKTFHKAFLSTLSLPHKLKGDEAFGWMASYQYIVMERFAALKQRIWCEPEIRMDANLVRGERKYPASRFTAYSSARGRRNSLSQRSKL